MADERMPKVDLLKDARKITNAELSYMKFIEKQNLERVQKLKKLKKRNIVTGLLLGSGVLAIYGYSMYAVKQEKFLDDFLEPEKTTN